MPFVTIAALIVAAFVLISLFLWASFVSASPGEVKVISGPRGQRVLHGKTGWKIPLLERVDTMTASMISVDAQTTDFVPTNDYINVRVDAAVKVRIATDDDTLFKAATRNFLYKTTSEISEEVRDTLEGHLRAIIGQMKLTDIITDRAAFSERVQENAKQDLEEMGLLIVAFNIQNVTDQNGVIDNLGIDNTEQIRKTAAIAKANAQKEVAQATAIAQKEANDAQVASQLEIAQKQTDLAKRQAALKVEADTEKAKADAAYEIQSQIQRRDIERETAQADIVKQEQQAVIKEKEVVVTKQALQAEVNAKADAERYAAEKKADAALYARQRQAEAEAFERTKKADADKQAMLAEAQGIEARGRAEASAIGAKLTAEAEGLEKKAEAMTKMNQAAVLEMYFRALPEVARAVAEPLSKVDTITMYGEGNNAQMVGDITKSISQINAGLGDSLGLDLQQMFTALVGAKVVSPTISEAVEEGVRDAIPWFDGGVVDNLVDYLTWTFLPALFMALHLPFGAQPMPVIMMIVVIVSSLFCYANDGEKSNDNYFVGFPAAWNCVAIVMYVLQTPAWVNIAATIFLAIMTLVPLHYTHPARVKRFQIPNIIGAAAWIVACAYMVVVYPVQPLWTLILFCIGGGWFLIAGFIRTATGEDKL